MTDTADSPLLGAIRDRQEVIGTCGGHVGVVDRVEGERIRLAGEEPDAARYLDAAHVRSVNEKVHLRVSAEDARAAITLR